ncbi:MAG: hypothetical protein EPO47_10615 [Rugosibacter sp.]|nr:MAG: hypothetical protein EPO47_10615 [Rugosibacter sp.]
MRSSRGKDAASVSGRQFYGADSRKDKHNLTPSLSTLHLMGAGAQQRIVEGLRAAVLTIWHHVEQIRSLASAPISELITDQTAELVDVWRCTRVVNYVCLHLFTSSTHFS